MTFIYTLSSSSDPNNIRYIGKTKDLKDRLRRHIGKYSINKEINYKNNWIKSELVKGNKIIIEEIDLVDDINWEYWEIYWIEQFKNWGFRLTNVTEGGEGIVLTNEIIKKRGSTRIKNNKNIKSDLIKKFNIKEVDNIWTGNRICPNCEKSITHSIKTLSKIVNLMIKSEFRNCYSCTRFICNKNKGSKDFGEVGKKYSKSILQFNKDGVLLCEFKSIREASELLKIDRKSISNCAKGIKWYGTAGGYIFKFK